MAPRLIVLLGFVIGFMGCQSDDDLPIMYNLEGEYSNWLTQEFLQDYVAISNLNEIDEHTHRSRHTEYIQANGSSGVNNHYESRYHSMFNGIYPVDFGIELIRYKEYTQLSVSADCKTRNLNNWKVESLQLNMDQKTYEWSNYEWNKFDEDTLSVVEPFDSVYQVLENKTIGGKTYPKLVQIKFNKIKAFGSPLSASLVFIEPSWGVVAYELNDGRIWTVQK